jgi:hypothetical protein
MFSTIFLNCPSNFLTSLLTYSNLTWPNLTFLPIQSYQKGQYHEIFLSNNFFGAHKTCLKWFRILSNNQWVIYIRNGLPVHSPSEIRDLSMYSHRRKYLLVHYTLLKIKNRPCKQYTMEFWLHVVLGTSIFCKPVAGLKQTVHITFRTAQKYLYPLELHYCNFLLIPIIWIIFRNNPHQQFCYFKITPIIS